MELKQSFLVRSFSKDRLTQNSTPHFLVCMAWGSSFQYWNPMVHKRKESRCAVKFPASAEHPQLYILAISPPQGGWHQTDVGFISHSRIAAINLNYIGLRWTFSAWQSFVSCRLAPHVLSPCNILACCLLAGLVYWTSPEKAIGNTYWSCG